MKRTLSESINNYAERVQPEEKMGGENKTTRGISFLFSTDPRNRKRSTISPKTSEDHANARRFRNLMCAETICSITISNSLSVAMARKTCSPHTEGSSVSNAMSLFLRYTLSRFDSDLFSAHVQKSSLLLLGPKMYFEL